MGKKAVIVHDDAIPAEYRFLPGAAGIRPFAAARRVSFGCLVTVDCSDGGRTGRVYALKTAAHPTLNIDHHVSNQYFADVNWVEPRLSSSSEQIFLLYKAMGIPFDRDSSLNLYTGIMTDTGSFRYSNTSADTHRAAAELMRYQIDTSGIYRRVYENMPYGDIRFLAAVYAKLKRSQGGEIIWFEIDAKTIRRARINCDLTERVLGFGRLVEGAEVVVLFREYDDGSARVRVNFRSQGKADVNAIATFFGGGGHRTASGATVPGTLKAVSRAVLGRIREQLAAAKGR